MKELRSSPGVRTSRQLSAACRHLLWSSDCWFSPLSHFCCSSPFLNLKVATAFWLLFGKIIISVECFPTLTMTCYEIKIINYFRRLVHLESKLTYTTNLIYRDNTEGSLVTFYKSSLIPKFQFESLESGPSEVRSEFFISIVQRNRNFSRANFLSEWIRLSG